MTQLAATFNRPADTLIYASGDLVANSAASGAAVVPMSFTLPAFAGTFALLRARLFKSTAVIAAAAFRLHLWADTPPVPAAGDNGVLLTTGAGNWVGAFDFLTPVLQGAGANVFSDGTRFDGVPLTGSAIFLPGGAAGRTLFGLLEARGAYPPGNAEAFTGVLELAQAD